MTWLDRVLSTVYPPSCAACDRPLPSTLGVCESCAESFEPIEAACPRCARPMPLSANMPCASCLSRRSALTSCTAVFEYGGQLARALQRLKFSKRSDIARTLAPLLQDSFSSVAARCDIAMPVPLHRRRLWKRGFNQSARLLAPLAKRHGIPADPRNLVRKHHTTAQSHLPRSERLANVRGAFALRGPIPGARVLLLDDIRTTGATLEAAAKALRTAGAREIHGFVVARTEWEG